MTVRSPVPAQPALPDPLFDPKTTLAPRCTACGTTRVNLCRFDADKAKWAQPAWVTRPKSCLNSAQNRDGIPYA